MIITINLTISTLEQRCFKVFYSTWKPYDGQQHHESASLLSQDDINYCFILYNGRPCLAYW